MKSPFGAAVVPLVSLVAALVRWWTQGSGNVWTTLHKRFYVADPDLGWRISVQHPIWLGLEICAILAAVALGLAVAGWIIRRREAKKGARATILRALTWIVAVASLAPPIAAFASGPGAANARDTLPTGTTDTMVASGLTGSLAAPAGTYAVVAHAGTSVTAKLSAGKETFDARFDGDVKGAWQGDPADLTKPMTADVSVDAASVDTGIGERSKHAREEYLHVDKFPRVAFTLDKIVAASPTPDGGIAFRAQGTVSLIGKVHHVEVTGTLRRADAAALGRLGLTGDVLLAAADFSLVIRETALAPDAGDFDGDRIPIHVSLVLRRTTG